MSSKYAMHGALGLVGWYVGGHVATKNNVEPLIGNFIGALVGWLIAEKAL